MDYRQKIEAKLKTLPHKYQVRYALDCALEVKHLMQDPRALKALEIIELWLQGKVTKDEFAKAFSGASGASASASASYSASAAYYASKAASYSAYAAVNAPYAAVSASDALNIPLKHYYTKLLKFIDNLTELEKVIYDIST